jgi:PPOX class probable F420-dependent enzyme
MTQGSPGADAKLESFLAEPRTAMVAALRADGRPQMTPNWFYWDGSRFFISTTKGRRKYTNLKRDPRVQLAIDDSQGFRTVLIEGTVEIWEEYGRQVEPFKRILGKHGQTVEDAAALARFEREKRVMLVVSPSKPPAAWTRWGL